MELNEKALFARSLLAIAEIYEKEIVQDYVEIYWGALKDYSLDDIREAFGAHVKNTQTGMFMPKPADVIKQIEKKSKDSSLGAWDSLMQLMRREGRYAKFDDSLTAHIVNSMGGMFHLCSLSNYELQKIKPDFEEKYFKKSQEKECIALNRAQEALEVDEYKKIGLGTDGFESRLNVPISLN